MSPVITVTLLDQVAPDANYLIEAWANYRGVVFNNVNFLVDEVRALGVQPIAQREATPPPLREQGRSAATAYFEQIICDPRQEVVPKARLVAALAKQFGISQTAAENIRAQVLSAAEAAVNERWTKPGRKSGG
jgi:hypothetical protein